MRKAAIAILILVILAVVLFFIFHHPRPRPRRYSQPSITGIGVALTMKNHSVEIMDVLPDTPAARAGLHHGLLIEEVDGTNIVGQSLAVCVAMMRGPVGSTVQLEIVDPANHETNLVEFTREKILLSPGRSPTKIRPASVP